MRRINKRIVTDEEKRPIAVQIEYQDWLWIERLLNLDQEEADSTDLARYSGTLELREDPLAYQARMRGQWS